MKISGKKIEGMNTQHIVIPRADGDIILVAQGVPSYKDFDKVCPMPTPPMKNYPDGRKEFIKGDKKFMEASKTWAERKTAWLIIASLSATPGLEWEMVDRDDPETWERYSDEMEQAGFSYGEITRIINGVMTANGINQAMIDEAEKRFLAGQAEAQ